ncbi:N-acetyltransferase [Luteimonas aestuarii]|uniref:N-acetyltransferase n=1 Tax=Luteimonas aestuarii TaxID=453837 RepID=A0A4R5U4S0_9GAMM|nr:GNAT family N-acetyltransferase [Luteimonas aestuarii]TDK28737.1 N-acetyltransferase [Luteimonas aestuarii]
MQSQQIQVVRGAEAGPWLEAVAALRIAVFRDWPYLYAGDPGYEREYLAAYAASPRSVFVLALEGDRPVGVSTGLPLADDAEAFRAPFDARGIDPGEVFYFGESVLLPAWRGRGIGHAFFDAREAHARTLGGFRWTAFAAVDRDVDDPRRPPRHRGNDAFWSRRGYVRQPGMTMRLPWEETGVGSTMHALTFWLRPLEHTP